MRLGEEHLAAKKALRRGNARRRSCALLCEKCSDSALLASVSAAGFTPAGMLVWLPERSMGGLLLSGGVQKSTPWIDTGNERHYVSIGHLRYVAVFANSRIRFVIQWS